MPFNTVNPFVPDFMLDLPTAWVWLVSALLPVLSLVPNPQSHTESVSSLSSSICSLVSLFVPTPQWNAQHMPIRSVWVFVYLFVCFGPGPSHHAVNTWSICQDHTRKNLDNVRTFLCDLLILFKNNFSRIPRCTHNCVTQYKPIYKSQDYFNASHKRHFSPFWFEISCSRSFTSVRLF